MIPLEKTLRAAGDWINATPERQALAVATLRNLDAGQKTLELQYSGMSGECKKAYLAGLESALHVKIGLRSDIADPVSYEIFDAGREAKVQAIEDLIVRTSFIP